MTVCEGLIRVGLFLLYIALISRMKDIQRTFMYHGAEHKCIICIEHGLELNVENVRKSSRQHKRCGTSFLFFVMIVSIIFCFFITAQSQIARVLIRPFPCTLQILLLPVLPVKDCLNCPDSHFDHIIIRLFGRHVLNPHSRSAQ